MRSKSFASVVKQREFTTEITPSGINDGTSRDRAFTNVIYFHAISHPRLRLRSTCTSKPEEKGRIGVFTSLATLNPQYDIAIGKLDG